MSDTPLDTGPGREPGEDDRPTAPDDPEHDGSPAPDETLGDEVPKVG